MLTISVVVIGAVGGAYAFVPGFQDGVGNLSNDVSVILAGGRIGDVGYNGVGNGTTGGSGGANSSDPGATVVTVAPAPPRPPMMPMPWAPFSYGGGPFGMFGFRYTPYSFAGIDNYGLVYQSFFGFHFFQPDFRPQAQIHHYQNICGAYALSSALASLMGKNETAQAIVQAAVSGKLNIFDSTGRVTAQGLASLAKSVGLCPAYHAGFDGNQKAVTTCADDLSSVDAALQAGKVPVMLIQVDENGNNNYGRHSNGSGHYVIPQSVTSDGVVVKDPVTGETKTLTRTEMCGAWDRQGREMVTLSAPSGGACST
ncbi:MAG TPA: hypothetical protein VMV18_01255 [bacterium]|nr:hypothetical protein [bacterium]